VIYFTVAAVLLKTTVLKHTEPVVPPMLKQANVLIIRADSLLKRSNDTLVAPSLLRADKMMMQAHHLLYQADSLAH